MTLGIGEIISLVLGGLLFIGSMLFKNERQTRKIAEKERDQASAKAQSIEEVVKAHEKRQQIEDDIAMGDHSNVEWMRDPYNRD